MRNKRLLTILALLATVFFMARSFSQLFLAAGKMGGDEIKWKFLKAANILGPLDYRPAYAYAFALLEEGRKSADQSKLSESGRWFRKAIARNPFYYLSHYYLGKSDLIFHGTDGEFPGEAISALKRSVLLNDNRDGAVALDAVRVFLSWWTHLNQADRRLCRTLLLKAVEKFSREDFVDVIEKVWKHSKDAAFLREVFRRQPAFQSDAVTKLTGSRIPLELRWSLLSDYEFSLFQQVKNYARSVFPSGDSRREKIDDQLDRLAGIRFYGRLTNEEGFTEEEYEELKTGLIRKEIVARLGKYNREPTSRLKTEIKDYSLEYIHSCSDLKRLQEFKRLLEKSGFWGRGVNDLKVLLLKFRLDFKLGNFSEMINEIEHLKESISFVKDEFKNDYIDVLLLWADSLESSKLLSLADRALREIVDRSPRDIAVYWRLLRIYRILGPDERYVEEKGEMFRRVRESRSITLDSLGIQRVVYLAGEREVEIIFPPGIREKSREKTIFQVFIDGKIALERYVEEMGDRATIAMGGDEGFSTHRVEIKFM